MVRTTQKQHKGERGLRINNAKVSLGNCLLDILSFD